MKKDGKVVLKGATKVLSLALAGTLMASLFTGCGKETTNKAEITTEVSTNQANADNQTTGDITGDILFEREDGAVLQLLVSRNRSTGEETFKAGYITFDKKGIYFDNALTSARITLTDVQFEHLDFYCVTLAEMCSENQLLNGKLSKEEVSEILKDLDYVRTYPNSPTVEKEGISVFVYDIIFNYDYANNCKEDIYVARGPYSYKIEKSLKTTTTYSDSEENLTEQLVKTIG